MEIVKTQKCGMHFAFTAKPARIFLSPAWLHRWRRFKILDSSPQLFLASKLNRTSASDKESCLFKVKSAGNGGRFGAPWRLKIGAARYADQGCTKGFYEVSVIRAGIIRVPIFAQRAGKGCGRRPTISFRHILSTHWYIFIKRNSSLIQRLFTTRQGVTFLPWARASCRIPIFPALSYIFLLA